MLESYYFNIEIDESGVLKIVRIKPSHNLNNYIYISDYSEEQALETISGRLCRLLSDNSHFERQIEEQRWNFNDQIDDIKRSIDRIERQ
jgi:hypothetical protein